MTYAYISPQHIANTHARKETVKKYLGTFLCPFYEATHG